MNISFYALIHKGLLLFLKKLGILHCLGFFVHLTETDSDFIDTYHD